MTSYKAIDIDLMRDGERWGPGLEPQQKKRKAEVGERDSMGICRMKEETGTWKLSLEYLA